MPSVTNVLPERKSVGTALVGANDPSLLKSFLLSSIGDGAGVIVGGHVTVAIVGIGVGESVRT
jgi:hypothetical protein